MRGTKLKIKLSKLVIKGFKGIKDFSLETGGESCVISGENGTGKTSVADAFYWLLTGSNLEQKSQFNIIRIGDEQAEVYADIFLGSHLVKIKKIYHPVYKNEVITGFKTDHFFDDVPVSQKEFISELKSLLDLRMMSDVHYFMSLSVAERRELIFKMADTVTDDQIIDEYEELKQVKGIFGRRDYTSCRKMLKAKRKELDEDVNTLPIEIKALEKSKPKIGKLTEKQIRKKIDDLTEKIADIKHGGDKIKRIALLEAEEIGLEADIKKQMQIEYDKLFNRHSEIKKTLFDHSNILKIETSDYETKCKTLFDFKDQIRNLAQRWKEEKALKFKPSSKCYACNQELPFDQITKQIDEWNKERAETFRQIDSQGKKLRKTIDNLEDIIPKKSELIEKIKEEAEGLEDELSAIEKNIKELDEKYETTVKDKSKAIKKQIKELKEQEQETDTYKLEDKRSTLEAELLAVVQAQKTDKSIAKLKEKLSEQAHNLERIDKELWLLEEFNRKKAEHIEQMISGKFKITAWKLFELRLNGSLKDTCEPYFEKVPFTDLNTGARINVGLDICNTFAEFYDLQCPVFVDNSESITNWIPTAAQMINLKAMEGVTKLKIN
jgi:DNA repair exonuclease SbcCD ATPase subunit